MNESQPERPEGFSVRDQFAGRDAQPSPAAPEAPKPFFRARPPRDGSRPPVRRPVTAETMMQTIDWTRMLRGVLRRTRMITFVTAAFGLLGLLGAMKLGRVDYSARTSLLYRAERQKQMLTSSGSTFTIRGLARNTAISLIRRAHNIEQVRAQLKLRISTDDLKWMTQTTSEKNSEIVLLSISDVPSEELAVSIVNALAAAAIDDNARFYRGQAQEAVEQFRTQARAARQELDQIEARLATFQATNRLVEAGADAKAFLDSVNATSERLSAARIARQAQQVRIANYRKIVADLPGEVLREAFEDNPIKRRISNTEVALMEARTKYGPENPRVLALEDEIKEMRRMLAEKTFDANREQIFEPNPAKKQFEQELLRLEAEDAVLEKSVTELEAELSGIEQRFAHLPRQQLELASLQQQRQAASEMYRALEAGADNAALAAQLDLADFERLEPARTAQAHRSSLVFIFPFLALFAGLLLGTGLAVALEFLDPRLRTARQLELLYTSACLGAVARSPDASSAALAARFLPVCRTLYDRWSARQAEAASPSLGVFSARGGEGKSTLALCLARYWSGMGLKTAYLDFDAAPNPGLAAAGLHRGLEDYLRGRASWDEVMTTHEGLTVAKVLAPTPDLLERLNTTSLARLWDTLRSTHAFIIVEAPGVLEDHSAGFLATLVETGVFVIASPRTPRTEVNAALDELERVDARPAGLLLNLADPGYAAPPPRRAARSSKG